MATPYDALQNWFAGILGDHSRALEFAQDPAGDYAAHGLADYDFTGVDIAEVMAAAAAQSGNPAALSAVQSYTGGGAGGAAASSAAAAGGGGAAAAAAAAASGAVAPPPASPPVGQPPMETILQHINYVTYETYEGDEYITQEITNIDNSTEVDVAVDGDMYGDIDVETDVNNVNATGDGAVAAGHNVNNAVTGDGAVLVDGDNSGQINTGDGAVQAGYDINAPVNTGTNTGIIADGDVDQAVVGDNNQTAQVDGQVDDSVINFGDGDVTNFGDAHFEDTAVAVGGGDATNVSDNYASEGSAIAAGDATGVQANTDINLHDVGNEDNYVDADNSVVNTEQGYGDAELDNEGDIYDDDTYSAEATATVEQNLDYEEGGDDYVDVH